MSEYDDRVNALERDIRFVPVRTEHPAHLSTAQVRFYNEQGYLSPFRVFGFPEAERNRADFDAILQVFVDAGKDSYAIDRYHDRIRAIYDLAKTPAILDIVSDLLGPNFVCWATHYFCKLPGDDKGVSWHQDCTYWPLTPTKTLTVWLAIDNADRENGCMEVIPGTHLLGRLRHRDSDASEHNVLTQALEHAERLGTPVATELRAGEMSIHSDLLVHGSLPNRSRRRRCGLTMRYCPTDVRAYWDWNANAIHCRGTDASGHWGNVPRPAATFTP
jgi:hypothetical protein